MKQAYDSGAQAALQHFGVRTASDLMSRRMPDGPEHLGAERLARTLAKLDVAPVRPEEERKTRRLERPTRWSNPSSVEGGEQRDSGMGLGAYGGI